MSLSAVNQAVIAARQPLCFSPLQRLWTVWADFSSALEVLPLKLSETPWNTPEGSCLKGTSWLILAPFYQLSLSQVDRPGHPSHSQAS